MKLTVDVKNIEGALEKFAKYGDEAIERFEVVTKIKAQEIVAEAKRLAPKDTGDLQKSIKDQKIDDLNYRITAFMKYAAYQEFGTGDLVEVPEEFAEIAAQFKSSGNGKVNLPPQPFMYPAFVKARLTFKKDLEDQLKLLSKKYD